MQRLAHGGLDFFAQTLGRQSAVQDCIMCFVFFAVDLIECKNLRIAGSIQRRDQAPHLLARHALLLHGQVARVQTFMQQQQEAFVKMGSLIRRLIQQLHVGVTVAIGPILQALQLLCGLFNAQQQLVEQFLRSCQRHIFGGLHTQTQPLD